MKNTIKVDGVTRPVDHVTPVLTLDSFGLHVYTDAGSVRLELTIEAYAKLLDDVQAQQGRMLAMLGNWADA